VSGGRRSLVLFGKYPVPGSVKTRLVPPLDPAGAAMLYRAFLVDALNMVSPLSQLVDITLLVADEADIAAMRGLMIDEGITNIELARQSPGSLGVRLLNAFRSAFASGARDVAIIGTDLPTLPVDYVREAFEAVSEADVVMGPAEDGGYYLIAMSKIHASVLLNMPYSTPEIARELRRRAMVSGLRLTELPAWYDVDDEPGLVRLQQDLALAGPMTRNAMRTYLQTGSVQ